MTTNIIEQIIQLFEDTQYNKPLQGYRIRITQKDANGNEIRLADTYPNAEGIVKVQIPIEKSENRSISKKIFNHQKIVIHLYVLGIDDKELLNEEIKVIVDKPEPISITVDTEKYLAALKEPIKSLEISLSRSVKSALEQNKINNLEDLRNLTDTKKLDDLYAADREQVEKLLAHARLQVVSRDPNINQTLIEKNYRSLLDITSTPYLEFLKNVKNDDISEVAVKKLYQAARKQKQILINIDTEQRVYEANGYQGPPQSSTASGEDAGHVNCCKDCDSAVSPAAYLADLMDYAVDHVLHGDGDVTLTTGALQTKFKQPFLDLICDCLALTAPVRQVRLVIEVLRALALSSGVDINDLLKQYTNSAYRVILSELELTHQRLREARHNESEKQRIEELIGIPKSKVLELLLNPQARTESWLEQLFGLQDTGRDPLSTGTKLNDEKDQIKRWQLLGINWHKNTDENGHIKGKLKKENNEYICELFKPVKQPDGSLSDILIAKGTTDEKTDTIDLRPENDSGLTGKIKINWQEDDNFRIVAMPELLAWQLQFLRELWRREDYNSETAALLTPIIDPDMLVNGDFIQPYDKNAAYKLFQHRKDWISDLENKLMAMSSLNDVLKRCKQEVKYQRESNANQEHKETLWSNFDATDFDEWDTTLQNLQSSNESTAEQAAQKLQDEIHLEMPQFQYLASIQKELRLLTGEEKTNYQAEVKTSAIQILLQAIKERFYSDWKEEEKDAGITLSEPFFWLNSEEPVLQNHRADAVSRTQWQEQLSRNSKAPILDPDRLTTAWFVGGNTADTSFNLYKERSILLQKLYNKLKTGLKSGTDLEKILTDIDFSSDGLTIHALGFSQTDLDALLDLLKEQKPFEIQPEQYGLTALALAKLLSVRDLAKSGDADNEDWEQARHVLIQAEKNRYLFPTWSKEEQEKEITISPDVFKFPDELADRIDLQPGASQAFREWRIDTAARRNFHNHLEDRIDRQNTVIAAHANLIDQVEDATLSTLRDELLNTEGVVPEDDKKTWFTNHYLINASVSTCQKTNRVAQAIETLQLLIWGLYTKQFEDSSFKLTPGDAFDEEWKWMGSYASWRSAMFVFLYPENILQPDFLDEKNRLNGFKAFKRLLNGWPSILNSTHTGQAEPDDGTQPLDENIEIIVRQVNSWQLGQAQNPPIFDTKDYLSRPWLVALAKGIRHFRDWGGDDPESLFARLEDFYYIPFAMAIRLQRKGEFIEALHWYNNIYDAEQFAFTENVNQILSELAQTATFVRNHEWLIDPLDLHHLALVRTGVFERTIIIAIVKCLLDYANSEFTVDTAESLARSRELYLSAQRLLNTELLKQRYEDCDDKIGELTIQIGDDVVREIVIDLLLPIIELNVGDLQLSNKWRELRQNIEAELQKWQNKSRVEIRVEVNKLISKSFPVKPVSSLDEGRGKNKTLRNTQFAELLQDPVVFDTVQWIDGTGSINPYGIAPGSVGSGNMASPNPLFFDPRGLTILGAGRIPYIPAPQANFCIPPNPILMGLRLHVITKLFNLNNCMNVAGIKREVPAFSAPTDTHTGAPEVNSAGSLVLPFASPAPPPTQYRYKVLVERARQLVSIAQQMEASYLSFLEKFDQESYSILRARQDLKIANANVTLQGLRVIEAENGKLLATKQLSSAEQTLNHYNILVANGLLSYEKGARDALFVAALAQGFGIISGAALGAAAGSVPSGGLGGPGGALVGSVAGLIVSGGQAAVTFSNLLSMYASFERRRQEWQFQKELADIGKSIAEIQSTLAENRYNLVEQEEKIARISANNAGDGLNFLNNKFTNAELYEWMSGVVSDIYRYFLQQATAMARLAQSQLAFERQERGLSFVQNDYWSVSSDAVSGLLTGEDNQDRRGLTGSARLLKDLTVLDQHAFLSDQRKLQLSKMISLASLDPIVFQQFRETGVLLFSTTLELFDRDFPGHYLRLIKRIRTTIIALVPPVEGIKATLSMDSPSRIVTEQQEGFAETQIIRTERQEVALTSPVNATGIFDLVEQPEMLLPFEGSGVAANWRFELPKAANPIDYSTIADVLITIDYTALSSDMYRQQVIQELGSSVDAMRPFSFRQQFVDAWYHLHHPGSNGSVRVEFEVKAGDFPPNVRDIIIGHVELYVAFEENADAESDITLAFNPLGSSGSITGQATLRGGGISTRRANAGSWGSFIGQSPTGHWTMNLREDSDLFKLLKQDKIDDILFVISYRGETAEWPNI